jgi:hypothetical protein
MRLNAARASGILPRELDERLEQPRKGRELAVWRRLQPLTDLETFERFAQRRTGFDRRDVMNIRIPIEGSGPIRTRAPDVFWIGSCCSAILLALAFGEELRCLLVGKEVEDQPLDQLRLLEQQDMVGPGNHRHLGVRDRPLDCDGVLDRHHIFVAEQDERSCGNAV